MPSGLADGCHVVNPTDFSEATLTVFSYAHLREDLRRGASYLPVQRRRSNLVAHNSQLFSERCQAQERKHKIPSLSRIHPLRTENEIGHTRLPNSVLTLKLCLPINILR